MQVDFSMPGRLGAEYVDENGERKTPVMLHRATLGSFERFIGILIEHFEGAMPVWLAPAQAVILNITDRQASYAQELQKNLSEQGFRVKADLRNEKIGFKIREHTLMKVPYLLVIGDKEMENNTVAVRTRRGEDLGVMSVESFRELMTAAVSKRGPHCLNHKRCTKGSINTPEPLVLTRCLLQEIHLSDATASVIVAHRRLRSMKTSVPEKFD